MTTLTQASQAQSFHYQPPKKLASLSVVMPAYNEAGNIQGAVHDALQAAALVADDYEVIVVDDGSKDGTGQIVSAMTR